MFSFQKERRRREPWNKGKLIGQKLPFSMQEIWTIRMHLQTRGNLRDLALFNLAIDSKLRACDLTALRVSDVAGSGQVQSRATIRQRKRSGRSDSKLPRERRNPLRTGSRPQTSTRAPTSFQADFAGHPICPRDNTLGLLTAGCSIGLDPAAYGTHSLRRTKATLIYRRTKNLRAVQLLLGHSKLESTVRYLGIEIDDALEMSEQIDV